MMLCASCPLRDQSPEPTATQRVRLGWGAAAPLWVIALAEEVDRTTKGLAARRLKFTPAMISHTLRNTYPHDYSAIEKRVRAVLAVPAQEDEATALLARLAASRRRA